MATHNGPLMTNSISNSVDYELQRTEEILNKLKDELDSQSQIQLPDDLAQTISDLCDKLPTLPRGQAQNFARRLKPLVGILDEISENLRALSSNKRVEKLVSKKDAAKLYRTAQLSKTKTGY